MVCFDTPVDDQDRADVDRVVRQAEAAFPSLANDAIVLILSQLPVGTVRRLETAWTRVAGGRRVSFACSPENLRLGKAIEVFTRPDRIIIGVRDAPARNRLAALFAPITDRVEWMSVESAEMSKHAVNAFLATSVAFINELATYFWNMPVEDNAFLLLERRRGRSPSCTPAGRNGRICSPSKSAAAAASSKIEAWAAATEPSASLSIEMLPEMGPPETTTWEFPRGDRFLGRWSSPSSWKTSACDRQPPPDIAEAQAALTVVERMIVIGRDRLR